MDGSENFFPSTFKSSSDKSSKEYLLQYAKDVWGQADNGRNIYNFESQTQRFMDNRRYSEGLNSVERFKQRFSANGDSTYMNMDWSVSTPLPKIVEVMRGQMVNQPFKAQFKPVDSLSISDVERARRTMLAKMKAKKALEPLEKEGAIKIDSKDLPEDEEELEVYMSTKFKLAQSMAMESLAEAIKQDNDYDYIENKIAKNLIDLKAAGVRIYLDSAKNICIRDIDPVNFVSSWVKKDDFSDAKFMGELIYVTIDDLRVMAPELTEGELYIIAKNAANRYNNPGFPFNEQYYQVGRTDPRRYASFSVKVLDFEMFSTDEMVTEKKESANGGYYYQTKDAGYQPPKNPKRKREIKRTRVKNIYCGKWVVGTDYIYDYGLKPHIVRKRINNQYSTNTQLGFIFYAPDILDMRNKSKVEEAIPYADALIRTQLKMQQYIAKSAPPGYLINVDAVVGALKGMGMGSLSPIDVRSLADQTGDFYYKGTLEDGTPISGAKPIEWHPGGIDQSVIVLANEYNSALGRMKEVLGINDAVDSTQPDKRTAVGVQQIALAAHKNALRTLYNAYLKINEETTRYITLLAQQLIRKGINIEKYKNWIGDEAVKTIDMGKLPYYEFAINVKMLPDEQDKAKIEEMLVHSIQAGTIKAEDVFAIRRLMNEDPDKAELDLAYREKRRIKEAQEQAQLQSQMNAQAQAQAAQAAEAAKAQTIQLENQLKMQSQEREYQLKIELEKVKGEEDRKTLVLETEGKKELIEAASRSERGLPANTSSAPNDSFSKPKDGYNLKTDSIPEEAGRVEPSVMPDPTRINV